jgi:hypothetical protein
MPPFFGLQAIWHGEGVFSSILAHLGFPPIWASAHSLPALRRIPRKARHGTPFQGFDPSRTGV